MRGLAQIAGATIARTMAARIISALRRSCGGVPCPPVTHSGFAFGRLQPTLGAFS